MVFLQCCQLYLLQYCVYKDVSLHSDENKSSFEAALCSISLNLCQTTEPASKRGRKQGSQGTDRSKDSDGRLLLFSNENREK